MPTQNQSETTRNFSPRILPWIVGLAMFLVYLATLNHWVTLANIWPVAKISGLIWQTEIFNPLQYLLTIPFHWLPGAKIPLVMNIFSAFCAAAILGLLARCVAILPHDRTEMERNRERSDYSFLTSGSAWFPPSFAAVMLGLEFGFWQNATSYTGEILALVPFTIVVWQLLEYRLDERPWRLTLAAFVYGLGIADNWAFIGFFPIFIVALIWLKGWEFFNIQFITRSILAGLLGLCLIFLLPTLGSFSPDEPATFMELLKPALKNNWQVIKAISIGDIRYNLLIMSVTTLLPLLVMSIRWSANFGDSSRIGTMLSSYMFHGIHAVIFGACVWVMFDPPFSPGERAMGFPALTLYFLSALALGYFAGYYVLVFGKKPTATKRNPRPLPALPGLLNYLSPLVYITTLGAAAVVVAAIAYKNLPQIRSQNDDTLLRYAEATIKNLPQKNAVLLSDPEGITSSRQTRTLIIQLALTRIGRSKEYLVVDTESLNWAPYHRYLHRKAPTLWPAMLGKDLNQPINIFDIINVFKTVGQTSKLCYLNPSFGYYFEFYYQEPRGLVYDMKPYPDQSLLPPPLNSGIINENQQFWRNVTDSDFKKLETALTVYKPEQHPNLLNWVNMHFHGRYEPNPNAQFVSKMYSRALNYWAVRLQRSGQVSAAGEWFSLACDVDNDNSVARINLDFNRLLQADNHDKFQISRVSSDLFGKYRNWSTVMNANGPYDEPSFCYGLVRCLMNNSVGNNPLPLIRQAATELTRVYELTPDELGVRLDLAQMYTMAKCPEAALEVLHIPLAEPTKFGILKTNATRLNVLASVAYFQKGDKIKGVATLEDELSIHPEDLGLANTAAQAYLMNGLYSNALNLINRQLTRTPDDPQWLFGKGYAYMQMSNYNQAVSAFTRVLQITTNDPTAQFNRAIAYLHSDQLNLARADYLVLKNSYTNAFQVSYGLAEIAWRQKNTPEAILYYNEYIANAPTNAAELGIARERLRQLQKN